MKIFKLPILADSSPDGFFRLGPLNENGTTFMLYGKLRCGEGARKIGRGAGNEEMVYILKGNMTVRNGKHSFSVAAGEAFAPNSDTTIECQGPEDAIYLAAGPSLPQAPLAEPVASPNGLEYTRQGSPSDNTEDEDSGFVITRDGGADEE